MDIEIGCLYADLSSCHPVVGFAVEVVHSSVDGWMVRLEIWVDKTRAHSSLHREGALQLAGPPHIEVRSGN